MTKAVQKITLSRSRDIPCDKLVLRQSNVRRIKAGVSVEELSEDVVHRGLLQSLSARPVVADDGTETDKFEIQAGGRRFQALSLLVKQEHLAKTTPIPCIARVVASAILAEDRITQEQLMAFIVNPDCAHQVEVWNVINSSSNKEPFHIRRMRTETSVRVPDRSAVFVGVEVYEAMGGTMRRTSSRAMTVARSRTLPYSIGQ